MMSVAPLLGVTALFLAGLFAFSVRSAMYGRPHTERVTKQGGSPLLGEYFMEYGLWMFRPVTKLCIRLHIHPDVLSWTSLVLHLVAAVALGRGLFGLGGWILVFGAACDALDGAVARARGLSSDAGEVLDAAVDRVAEMAVFFGYAWYFRTDPLGFVLTAAACIGAVMVSYARAKGEGYGIDAKMGLMQRHERAVYLAVGALASSVVAWYWEPGNPHPRHYVVLVAMALVAVFANLTGIQRTAFTRAELRKKGQ
jgi:CDP-diacylglycerol--glycerol-3-phosphate 3-phosphatidyltransferase